MTKMITLSSFLFLFTDCFKIKLIIIPSQMFYSHKEERKEKKPTSTKRREKKQKYVNIGRTIWHVEMTFIEISLRRIIMDNEQASSK